MIQICILDDHPILADGIRRLLQTEDNLSVIADYRTIDAFLGGLDEHPMNVAIIDILLKEESGITAIGHLRQRRPDVPVIALSMYSTEPYFSQALNQGASAYVTKGRAHDEIVPAIHAVLSGDRYFCSESRALAVHNLEAANDAPAALTTRETEIFRHLALGLAPKQIASLLGINAKTVHVHKANIAKKIGVHYQADYVKAALARGLIAAEDLTI